MNNMVYINSLINYAIKYDDIKIIELQQTDFTLNSFYNLKHMNLNQ